MTSAQCLENLPSRDYHAMLDRQSCSMLKSMLVSPAHYMQQLLAPVSRKSASMDFGTLVHLLVLEPHRLPFEYDVGPVTPRRRACGAGRVQISEIELHEARRLADRVLHAKVAGREFGRYVEEGKSELTLLFDEPTTDVACRSRLDLWHPDIVFDLKTTRHCCPVAFRRSALELDYDMQAYMYGLAEATWQERTALKPFYFLAAESSPPYTVQVVRAGESFLENGQAKFQRAIGLVKACSALAYWPDAARETTLEIEPWQAFRSDAREGAQA